MDCNPTIAAAVVGSVVGTLVFCGLIVGLVFLIRYFLRKRRREKFGHHNALDRRCTRSDSAEGGLHNEAYQRDSLDKNFIMMMADGEGSSKRRMPSKSKVKQGFTERTPHISETEPSANEESITSDNKSALDDTQLDERDNECVEVKLVSKDIIGLGFNVRGNMRDGIIVSHVHDRGPAKDSGVVTVGDKVLSVTISFENVVYEDALTILSYASPYPVTLKLAKSFSTSMSDKQKSKDARIYHPMYRSQSLGDINKPENTVSRSATLSYLSQDSHSGAENSDEETRSDCGTLRKNKFGNTLNLTEARDSMVELNDNRASSTSNSQTEASSNVSMATDQEAPSPQPIVAEVVVTEATLTLKSEIDTVDNAAVDNSEQEATNDSTSRKAPAHLPASIRTLIESKRSANQAVEVIEANVAANAKHYEKNNNASLNYDSKNAQFPLTDGAMAALDSLIADEPLIAAPPELCEQFIKAQNVKPDSSDKCSTSKQLDDNLGLTTSSKWNKSDSDSPSLDNKRAVAEGLVVDTKSKLEQADLPSPNDSGIHSEPLSDGGSAPQSPPSNASPASVTSKQGESDDVEKSLTSDDMLAAVLNVGSSSDAQAVRVTVTSEYDVHPSDKSILENVATETEETAKAKTRSQLEVARAQFFADLMSSSSLFQESPKPLLTLSSESHTPDNSPPTTSRQPKDDHQCESDNNNSAGDATTPGAIPPQKPKRLLQIIPDTASETDA